MPARRTLSVIAFFAFAMSPIASGQEIGGRKCSEILAASTRDSVTVTGLLQLRPNDRKVEIPDWFITEIGQEIRAQLVQPAVSSFDTYVTDTLKVPVNAHVAVRGEYEASLTHDGRLLDPHVTGGARNRVVDQAMIAAMRAVDSSGALKSWSPAALPDGRTSVRFFLTTGHADRVEDIGALSEIVITAGAIGTRRPPESSTVRPDSWSETGFAVALFDFRVPVRNVTRPIRQLPGTGGIRFPDNLYHQGASGDASMSFVVNADGTTPNDFAVVLRASQPEFGQSAAKSIPSFRFNPLQVAGCDARQIVEQIFVFTISH